jgi:uncharacterized protein (DUF305 family)
MEHSDQTKHGNHYRKLLIMAALSFIAMYFLMYSMVDSFGNVINNINQLYMAGLMTAPMVIIEMALMGSMYKNKKLNVLIISISSFALIFCFLFIRKQAAVSDKQFLKSMIPHHAAAILMVKETQLQDPEIQKLARDIISAQQREIEFMKDKLKQMEQ